MQPRGISICFHNGLRNTRCMSICWWTCSCWASLWHFGVKESCPIPLQLLDCRWHEQLDLGDDWRPKPRSGWWQEMPWQWRGPFPSFYYPFGWPCAWAKSLKMPLNSLEGATHSVFLSQLLILSVLDVRHAAVSAQSFEARLLTQMVRLPIPSWQDRGGWNSQEFAVGLVVSCLPMGRFLSEDLTHSEQYKNIVGISQVQLMCNCRADAPTNIFRNIRQ